MGPWLTSNASQPQHGYGHPVQPGQPVYAAVRGEYMAHHALLAHPYSNREIQLTPDQAPHFNHQQGQQQQYRALLAAPPPASQQQPAPQLPQRQPQQQQQQMSTATATATPATTMAMTPAATTLAHTADYIVTISLPQWPTLDLIYYPNGSVHVLSAGQGKGQLTAPKLPLDTSGTRTTAAAAAAAVVRSGGDGSDGSGGGGGIGAPRCSIVQDAEVTQELHANGDLLYSVAGGSGISLCEDLSRRGFSMGTERRCLLGAVVSSAPSAARRTAERQTTEGYEWRGLQPVAAGAADGGIHGEGWAALYHPTDGTARPPLVAAATVAAGDFDPHLHTLTDERGEPVVVPSSSTRRDKVCWRGERERERS